MRTNLKPNLSFLTAAYHTLLQKFTALHERSMITFWLEKQTFGECVSIWKKSLFSCRNITCSPSSSHFFCHFSNPFFSISLHCSTHWQNGRIEQGRKEEGNPEFHNQKILSLFLYNFFCSHQSFSYTSLLLPMPGQKHITPYSPPLVSASLSAVTALFLSKTPSI